MVVDAYVMVDAYVVMVDAYVMVVDAYEMVDMMVIGETIIGDCYRQGGHGGHGVLEFLNIL